MKIPDKKGGSIYTALFIFCIFLLSIFKIKSYDLWWHIKAGEIAIGAGFKPVPANTFSWIEPNHPWINFSWFFDVIVYMIHKIAGFNALIIFQAVLVTSLFFVVYNTVFQSARWACKGRHDACLTDHILILSLFLIAYFAARFRFSLRPHLPALLIFGVDVYLLNRLSAIENRQSANVGAPVFLIPLLQILWVNIHGSAILGVLLPGVFAIGHIAGRAMPVIRSKAVGMAHHTKVTRRFIFILFLTLMASLVNPYGYRVLTYPFAPFFGQGADLFNMLTVDEWQMPDKGMFLGWYGLLLTLGGASFFLSFVDSPRRSVSTDLLLFSIFALLSIKAVRFIDLFVVVAVPVIYKNLYPISLREKAKGDGILLRFSLFAILALFLFIGVKDTTFTLGLGVDEDVVPKKAVEFMQKNGVEGKIFNSYNFGGYLIYKGFQVFMDGRLCYSPEVVRDFADANLTTSGWEMVEAKNKPDIVIIEYDKPAIPEALLTDKKNWSLVYWDDLTMLFLRRDGRFLDIIKKNDYTYLNPMNMYGLPSGLKHGAGDALLQVNSAIFNEALRRVKDGPDSMRAHLLFGNLYLGRMEPDKAAVEYSLVADSTSSFGKAEAHNNLGTAYEAMGDVDGAEAEYSTAITLDRGYPLPLRNLGYLELEKSRYIEALWRLEGFLGMDKGDKKTADLVSKLRKYRDILILRVLIGGGAILGIFWVAARRFAPSEREV